MDQLFYFKEGEGYVCTHPTVVKTRCYGSLSDTLNSIAHFHVILMMKDGSEAEFIDDFKYEQVNKFLSEGEISLNENIIIRPKLM